MEAPSFSRARRPVVSTQEAQKTPAGIDFLGSGLPPAPVAPETKMVGVSTPVPW